MEESLLTAIDMRKYKIFKTIDWSTVDEEMKNDSSEENYSKMENDSSDGNYSSGGSSEVETNEYSS